MTASPFVCFQLFTLSKGQRYWAFRQMGLPLRLPDTTGLRFAKRLGTGGGEGFSRWPDWRRYALLSVWEAENQARDFMQNHSQVQAYVTRSKEHWWTLMEPVRVHGLWDGQNPFQPLAEDANGSGPLVVLTRANIRLRRLAAFWRQVPDVSRAIAQAEGLGAKIGLGEYPLLQQATLSVWKNADAMQRFAYRGEAHSRAVRDTQRLQWYSEELFARFRPLDSGGSWNGRNPLGE